MFVRSPKFSVGPNALERAVEGSSEYSGGESVSSDSSSDIEVQAVPSGVTASAPLGEDEQLPPKSPTSRSHKSQKSTDTIATTESHSTMLSSQTGKTGQTGDKHPEEAVPEMSKEELLSHRK
jgi:hypothetical protein